MNNADMPITPIVNENGHPQHYTRIAFDNIGICAGLTKREHFAGLAMQAILTKGDISNQSEVASDALAYADALLAELDKPLNT